MIYSMTAFARRADQNQWGTAAWEIRSVNHRYLEVMVRLPESLRELEPSIRERIRKQIQRGKVECFLKYVPYVGVESTISLNTELVKQLAQAAGQVNTLFPKTNSATIMEILAWPSVINLAESNLEVIKTALFQLFDLALKDLIQSRQHEGQEISRIIKERLVLMKSLVTKIKHRVPATLDNQRKKLIARFEEAKLALNQERFEQEMLMFAQRIDVTEELERLEIHAVETEKTLQQGGAVGRRLDFLMQELNREANTLASKSTDTETSTIAVELKVLIEQMREQVQNVE